MGGFGDGRPDGMEPPEGFDPGQGKGESPEGRPGGGGQPPEGFDPSQGKGERPDGMEPPADFDPDKMGRPGPDGFGGEEISGDGETNFTLAEQANNFSGVIDFAPEAQPESI